FNTTYALLQNNLTESGFEVYPFLISWYNSVVDPLFRLSTYNDDTVAFLVVSTPSMFEKTFLPYALDSSKDLSRDPIDCCVKEKIQTVIKKIPDYDIDVIFDYDLWPTRRPKIVMQTVGHVAGAARFYSRQQLANDPFPKDRNMMGVCLHPKYGGCLIQWLKVSRKEECELCGTKFRFTPIYHPSMPPGRLPLKDLINGLFRTFFKALRYWLHYLIVAFCWLGVVPITASRIYRCLFAGSISSILTLPYDIVSTDNLFTDVLQGGLVVFCSLGAFICLLWLREQILSGGGPAWLQPAEPEPARQLAVVPPINFVLPIAPIEDLPLPDPTPALPVLLLQPLAPNNVEARVAQNQPEHEDGAFLDAVNDEDDENDDDDEDEQANLVAQPADIAENAQNQENNHNWIDWDRAADDLTWERLLGLDGSLQFLEHVFWVVTLNTLFILIFAYAPFHIGKIITSSKNFRQAVTNTRFETAINTLTTYGCVNALIGYIFISFFLLISFTILSFVNYLTRIRRVVGLAYIVLKVALLIVLEILLFPFICGIWLDICSLRILNERTITLNDRLTQFQTNPGTSTFLHWLCGMVFVFYFATFIFLLREVLRPGALWFLKSINDLDFNPIQEMIQLPLALHLRRFISSIIIFGCVIILMFYVPGELLIRCIPKFLPFNVKGSLETVVSELMIEFILLQGILPTLLEQGHTRTMLKHLLQLWVELASWILGLRSFLLGDTPSLTITNAPQVDQNDNVLPMPIVAIPDQPQNDPVEQAPPVQI
ncbi:unnamed protein product, partial [Rotaria magnacalcarata]